MSEAGFARPELNVNLYKKANPLKAVVLENRKLNANPESDVHHITFKIHDYPFREGQSAGVLPPGINEKGKPHNPRLYSIASESPELRQKPEMDLCVKRVVYQNEAGETVKGVASNYLCDLRVGDEVDMTGPVGRHFVLPAEEDIHRPYIFIATGTGIAPFRGMLRRLFYHTKNFDSLVYLFKGVRYTTDLLYHAEFQAYEQDNFHYVTAISREEKNAQGGRKYVGDSMIEKEEGIWELLSNPRTLIYLCGLKGMTEGVHTAIRHIAEKKGQNPDDFLAKLEPQILTEVY